MLNIVKVFENGTVLFFDEGQFDEYCVYQLNEGEKQFAPRDKNYFDFLKTLSDKYGAAYVYKDFVNIYNHTNKEIDDGVLQLISGIASNRYSEEKVTVDIQFTILYMTMLAEENKKYTKLGKRIKRKCVVKEVFNKNQKCLFRFFSYLIIVDTIIKEYKVWGKMMQHGKKLLKI